MVRKVQETRQRRPRKLTKKQKIQRKQKKKKREQKRDLSRKQKRERMEVHADSRNIPRNSLNTRLEIKRKQEKEQKQREKALDFHADSKKINQTPVPNFFQSPDAAEEIDEEIKRRLKEMTDAELLRLSYKVKCSEKTKEEICKEVERRFSERTTEEIDEEIERRLKEMTDAELLRLSDKVQSSLQYEIEVSRRLEEKVFITTEDRDSVTIINQTEEETLAEIARWEAEADEVGRGVEFTINLDTGSVNFAHLSLPENGRAARAEVTSITKSPTTGCINLHQEFMSCKGGSVNMGVIDYQKAPDCNISMKGECVSVSESSASTAELNSRMRSISLI